MDEQQSYSVKGFAESITPYGADDSRSAHTKLSISLPSDLVDLVREAAAEAGLTVSAAIGASLRRTLEDADQDRLERAIDAQNEENLDWAKAYLPINAALWADLER
jgi:Ribbon-helix-helix protein, copG family